MPLMERQTINLGAAFLEGTVNDIKYAYQLQWHIPISEELECEGKIYILETR